MFTISSPENPQIGKIKMRTLGAAIRTKHRWEIKHLRCHAIITDSNGYVVSSREQSMYLTHNWGEG